MLDELGDERIADAQSDESMRICVQWRSDGVCRVSKVQGARVQGAPESRATGFLINIILFGGKLRHSTDRTLFFYKILILSLGMLCTIICRKHKRSNFFTIVTD